MNNTVRVISEHAKNGVVPLTILKKGNYPIFRYFFNNYKIVLRQLKEHGFTILNDLKTLNNIRKIQLYLLYYYGNEVNISLIRKTDRTVYNYLSKRGKPYIILESLGFSVSYNKYSTEEYIVSELYRLADSENRILTLVNSRLYDKLYYRAKKLEISIVEYVNLLGFKYRDINISKIKKLREQGKSFSEISKIMCIPRSTIHRIYLREFGG